MRTFVRFRMPDGQLVDAAPGDLVGRLPTAAVHLNDPRISEAHALVSLRGRDLRLLALRGRFAVAGAVSGDLALAPGQTIQLAPGIELLVVVVSLGDGVPGLEGPDVPRQILPPVASILADGSVAHGFQAEACALLWTAGEALHLRLAATPDEPDRILEPGDTFEVDGHGPFRVVSIALQSAASPPTERDSDLDLPLVIVLRFDTVHIHRGATAIAIDGQPARLVSELGLMRVPVEWRTLARLLWPDEPSETGDGPLRSRFDRVLTRLRARLRQHGLRPDLVRTDGSGRVELLLGPKDRVKDET